MHNQLNPNRWRGTFALERTRYPALMHRENQATARRSIPDDVHAAPLASSMEWRLLPFFSCVNGGSELQKFSDRADGCLSCARDDTRKKRIRNASAVAGGNATLNLKSSWRVLRGVEALTTRTIKTSSKFCCG